MDQLTEATTEAFQQYPDYAVITSFPGLADLSGARVLGEIGDDRGVGVRGQIVRVHQLLLLDLVLGSETQPGLRWPDLSLAAGRVSYSALRDALPKRHGVTVLSGSRVLSGDGSSNDIDVAPLGAVIASTSIYQTFLDATQSGVEFFHGYTYSGHPLAIAAGLAAQDIYREDDVYAQATALAPYFEEAMHSLAGEPFVTDIRNLGLAGGLSIEPRADGPRAPDVFLAAFEEGVIVRANGDTIAVAPILTSTRADIDDIVEAVRRALRSVR